MDKKSLLPYLESNTITDKELISEIKQKFTISDHESERLFVLSLNTFKNLVEVADEQAVKLINDLNLHNNLYENKEDVYVIIQCELDNNGDPISYKHTSTYCKSGGDIIDFAQFTVKTLKLNDAFKSTTAVFEIEGENAVGTSSYSLSLNIE